MAMGSIGGFLPITGGTLTGDIAGNGSTSQSSNFIAYVSTAAGAFYWSTRSVMRSPSDGVIRLTNNAETDFTRLQFGGTTSSFPALKRVGPAISTRRADDTIGVFADLPAAATGNEGATYPISDSTTVVWGATITGGGANHVLAYSNGTNWTVAAK